MTATWGVARVDAAMAPILRQIDALRGELATLEQPDTPTAATADAVTAWEDATAHADITVQRALIRRAFPELTLAMPRRYGDHSPERFHWDGIAPPTAAPPTPASPAAAPPEVAVDGVALRPPL